jgi:hypothetical protein
MTLMFVLAVAAVAGIGISDKVYNAKVQIERNERVKEINRNVENGLKTTNRILDLVSKKPN